MWGGGGGFNIKAHIHYFTAKMGVYAAQLNASTCWPIEWPSSRFKFRGSGFNVWCIEKCTSPYPHGRLEAQCS